ncbi:hypothetical protein DVH24_035142 [Malus domestica]|uniref:Uncharacterized protein n=1 Tax=Malus domestica TaxID=3750 RepID=A0A498J451_MALDO|nr:hypothetical protein DVH24_035142 [Malus domestica]
MDQNGQGRAVTDDSSPQRNLKSAHSLCLNQLMDKGNILFSLTLMMVILNNTTLALLLQACFKKIEQNAGNIKFIG